MDPLQEYFEGIKDAPVPARLMAETPPEALARRAFSNLGWAAAGVALCLALGALPTPVDPAKAERQAQAVSQRVARRVGAER